MGRDFIKSANKSIEPKEINMFLGELEKRERRMGCSSKFTCPYYYRPACAAYGGCPY